MSGVGYVLIAFGAIISLIFFSVITVAILLKFVSVVLTVFGFSSGFWESLVMLFAAFGFSIFFLAIIGFLGGE